MKKFAALPFALLVVLCDSASSKPDRLMDLETGVYEGNGRACYGKFIIAKRSLDMNPTAGPCHSTSFAVIDRKFLSKENSTTIEILRHSKRCPYQFLILSHDNKADSDIGWNLQGFDFGGSRDLTKRPNDIGCYLVKLPGNYKSAR